MSVRVANIRKLHRSDDETRVYIGRRCQGYVESPLANPFRSKDLPGGKEEAIAKYQVWLRSQLRDKSSAPAQEILRLGRLASEGASLVLMCWCHPSACHGDIVCAAVLEVARRIQSQVKEGVPQPSPAWPP